MSDPTAPTPGLDESGPGATRPRRWQRWAPREELRAGAVIIGVLAVVGALVGVLWQWWSPPGGLGYVVAPGQIQADETENFIAADGRFALLCVVIGIVTALVVWRMRRTRGPVAAAALVVGGLLGALLTATVGALLGGGSDKGPTNTLLPELPLRVHMHGLLLLEAAVAALVYSVSASFAVRDDLGRPEPGAPPPAESVPVGGQLEHGRGDGDAAGGLEQA